MGQITDNWAWVLVLAALGGCATTASQTSWEDDIAEGVATSVAKPAEPVVDASAFDAAIANQVAQELDTTLDPLQLAKADEEQTIAEISRRLELSMLRFSAEIRMVSERIIAQRRRQRRRRKRRAKKTPWPTPIIALWKQLLDELDDGLSVAPDALVPKRVLLQARVTTEAEFEMAEVRFGVSPSHVSWRVKDMHATVDRLMQRNALALSTLNDMPVYGRPRLGWPLASRIYTSPFGYRKDPISGAVKFHTGIDLAARRGTLVTSAAPGRIIFAGWGGGYGKMVVVQHPGGYQTLYAHLSRVLVPKEGLIEAETIVGQVGNTGRSTGPHLHFEVRHGGNPIDPMKVLGTAIADSGHDRPGDDARGGR